MLSFVHDMTICFSFTPLYMAVAYSLNSLNIACLFCFCEAAVRTTDYVPQVTLHICLTSVLIDCAVAIKAKTSVQ